MKLNGRRAARWIAVGACLAIACWLASSFWMLHKLRARERPMQPEHAPADWAERCEELRLNTSDGVELGAWFVEAPTPGAPIAIVLHGKDGSRSSRVACARVLQKLGCSTLLVTLRGHGDSTGDEISFGWSERRDVVAAVEWAERRQPASRIVISGFSLGGAAAVFAARELGDRVVGYELECLYADLDTAARNRCAMQLPPVFDVAAHLGLRVSASLMWPEWSEISPRDRIADIASNTPILIFVGAADAHATVAEAEQLRDRVADHAELVVIEGADHNGLIAAAPERYEAALSEWLARVR